MTVIAHLTDIHYPQMRFPSLLSLNLKQFLGLLNWHWSRKKVHQSDVLTLLIDDLKHQILDHTLISGDLVNLGLESEFEAGAQWLDALGGRDAISFVPGNHDYYGEVEVFYGHNPLPNYMRSCSVGASLGGGDGPDEPYVKIINNVALIGVNSAIPTPLFKAFGQVQEATLDQLTKILHKAKTHGFYRCVAVHHPPLKDLTKPSRAMLNDEAFTTLLRDAGAELVLYGHNHIQRYHRLLTTDGACHVVGCPSASVGEAHKYDLARYNLFDIKPIANGWETTMIGRGIDKNLQRIGVVERRVLSSS